MLKNEVFYRAVTIERVEPFAPKDPTPAIYPGMLHSISPEFYDAGQVLFGWRWYLTKNAGDRGLVTLEDTDIEIPAQSPDSESISVKQLAWMDMTEEDYQLSFNWAWLPDKQGKEYRVLILE